MRREEKKNGKRETWPREKKKKGEKSKLEKRNGRESTELQLHLCGLKNTPCDLWELQSITDSTKTERIRRRWEQCRALRTSTRDLSANDCYKYDLSLIESWFKRVSREQMLESYFYNSRHMNAFENLLVKMAPACICLSSKQKHDWLKHA